MRNLTWPISALMNRYVFSVVLILLAVASDHGQQGAANITSRVDVAKYFRVLDRIFVDKETERPDVVGAIIVRFMPSFGPETGIILIRTAKKVKVIRLRSGINLYHRIDQMGKLPEAEIVATILKTNPLERAISEMPVKEFDQWLTEIIAAASETNLQLRRDMSSETENNYSTVVLDGAFYQVSVVQRLNRAIICLYDESPNSAEITGRYALTQAINKLRLQIQSSIAQGRGN